MFLNLTTPIIRMLLLRWEVSKLFYGKSKPRLEENFYNVPIELEKYFYIILLIDERRNLL